MNNIFKVVWRPAVAGIYSRLKTDDFLWYNIRKPAVAGIYSRLKTSIVKYGS